MRGIGWFEILHLFHLHHFFTSLSVSSKFKTDPSARKLLHIKEMVRLFHIIWLLNIIDFNPHRQFHSHIQTEADPVSADPRVPPPSKDDISDQTDKEAEVDLIDSKISTKLTWIFPNDQII